jgi:hypothetical protein
MKRAIRMILLMVGLLGVYNAITLPAIALDGAPPPYCPPPVDPNCK